VPLSFDESALRFMRKAGRRSRRIRDSLRAALLPPLGDNAGIETNRGSDKPTRNETSFRLAVNSDRMKMKNLRYFASCEGAMIRAEDLGDV